ncbi:MAG: hypothetical protein Q9221_008554 [Calogaya cf. arnoldii]
MLMPFKLALLALAVARSTTATPLSQSTNPTLSLPETTNATASLKIPPGFDPRFSAHVAVPGSQSLDIDTGLLGMSQMIYELSLKDFNGMISPQGWESGRSGMFFIEIKVLPGQRLIPIKYAVWGAQLLGEHFLSQRRISDLVWALTYGRELVGYIEITGRPPQPRLGGSSSGPVPSTHSGTAGLETKPQPAVIPRNADDGETIKLIILDDRLSVKYRVVRNRPLSIWELFTNIFGILGQTSTVPPFERSRQTWVYTSNLFPDTHFQLLPVTELEYRLRARVAYDTAIYVIQNQIFFTLAMRIDLDGEVVCRGSIYKGNVAPGLVN